MTHNFKANLTPPDTAGDNRGIGEAEFGYGSTVKGEQTSTPSGSGSFIMRDSGNWERPDRVSTVKG